MLLMVAVEELASDPFIFDVWAEPIFMTCRNCLALFPSKNQKKANKRMENLARLYSIGCKYDKVDSNYG